MKLFRKIKTKGLRGIAHAIVCRLSNAVNIMAYYFYLQTDMNQNLIIFESEGDMSDNSFALYYYMKNNNLLEKKEVVWLVSCDYNKIEKQYANVQFFHKYPERIEIKRSKALATAKYYIFDHSNVYDKLRKRNGFKIIYLTHGCTFKKATNIDQYENNADEVYYTGKLYTYSMERFCCCRRDIMSDIGYPRNDFLFGKLQDKQISFIEKYALKKYKKTILWMPTFRKSINKDLSEDYFNNFTGLPILESEEDLYEFNALLSTENLMCIFKIHHLQVELPAFKTSLSNVLIVNDDMLSAEGLQLYQMVRITDYLITDYSSIGNDYMLMDKPIIYTLDDYEQYRDSRGFSIDDPAQYFIGEHVVNKEQLFVAVIDAGNGIDKYKKERNDLLPLAHTYRDGHSSKRIVERLGLNKT